MPPDSTAQPLNATPGMVTAPNPSQPHTHETDLPMTDTEPPSPYRFTVSVDVRVVKQWREVWLTIDGVEGMGWCMEEFMFGFPTKAEAREHAALVLAALHQATLEETP